MLFINDMMGHSYCIIWNKHSTETSSIKYWFKIFILFFLKTKLFTELKMNAKKLLEFTQKHGFYSYTYVIYPTYEH